MAYKVYALTRYGTPELGWVSLTRPSNEYDEPVPVEIEGATLLKSISVTMEREFTRAAVANFPLDVHDPEMTWFDLLSPGGGLQADAEASYFPPWIKIVDVSTSGTVFFGYLDHMSLEHEPKTNITSFNIIPAINLLNERKLSDFVELLRPNPTIPSSSTPTSFTVRNQDIIAYNDYISYITYEDLFEVNAVMGWAAGTQPLPMYKWYQFINSVRTSSGTPYSVRETSSTIFGALLAAGKIPWQYQKRSSSATISSVYVSNTDGSILYSNSETINKSNAIPLDLPSPLIQINGEFYPCHLEWNNELEYYKSGIKRIYYPTLRNFTPRRRTDEQPISQPTATFYTEISAFIVYGMALIVLDTPIDLRSFVDVGSDLTFSEPNDDVALYQVVTNVVGSSESYDGDKFLELNTVDQLVPGDEMVATYTGSNGDVTSSDIKIRSISGLRNRIYMDGPFATDGVSATAFTGVLRKTQDPVQVNGFDYITKACAPYGLNWDNFENYRFDYPVASWLPYDICSGTPVYGAFWLTNLDDDHVMMFRRDGTGTKVDTWYGDSDNLAFSSASSLALGHYGSNADWMVPANSAFTNSLLLFNEGDTIAGHRINGYGVQPWRSHRRLKRGVWNATANIQAEALDVSSSSSFDETSPTDRNAWRIYCPRLGRAYEFRADGSVYYADEADSSSRIPSWSVLAGSADRDSSKKVYAAGISPYGGLMYVEENLRIVSYSGTTKMVDTYLDSFGSYGVRVDVGGGLAVQHTIGTWSSEGVIKYPLRSRLKYIDASISATLDLPCLEVVAHTICPIEWDENNMPTGWVMLALEDYNFAGNLVATQVRVRFLQVSLVSEIALGVVNGEVEPHPIWPNDKDFEFRRGVTLLDELPDECLQMCMVRINQNNDIMGILAGRPFWVSNVMKDYIERVPVTELTALELLSDYCAAHMAAAIPEGDGDIRIVSRTLGEQHYTSSGGSYYSFNASYASNMRITAMLKEYVSEVNVTYTDNKVVKVRSSFGGGVPADLDFSYIINSPMAAVAIGQMYCDFFGNPMRKYSFTLPYKVDWLVGDKILPAPVTTSASVRLCKLTKLDWDLDNDVTTIEMSELPYSEDLV